AKRERIADLGNARLAPGGDREAHVFVRLSRDRRAARPAADGARLVHELGRAREVAVVEPAVRIVLDARVAGLAGAVRVAGLVLPGLSRGLANTVVRRAGAPRCALDRGTAIPVRALHRLAGRGIAGPRAKTVVLVHVRNRDAKARDALVAA